MRCLSPTNCGSRVESGEASPSPCSHPQRPPQAQGGQPSAPAPPHHQRCPAAPAQPLPQAGPQLLPSPTCPSPSPPPESWSQYPGPHRDVGFLCDDLEHICDRNVAKPPRNGQGSGAVLCREEGLGQQQPRGSPVGHLSLLWGREVWASAVLTVLISLGEAPCFSSSVTTSVWPCCAAWCRGV